MCITISVLTNVGTMFYGAIGTLIVPVEWVAVAAAALDIVITADLLMFASIDVWNMKARVAGSTDLTA